MQYSVLCTVAPLHHCLTVANSAVASGGARRWAKSIRRGDSYPYPPRVRVGLALVSEWGCMSHRLTDIRRSEWGRGTEWGRRWGGAEWGKWQMGVWRWRARCYVAKWMVDWESGWRDSHIGVLSDE